MVTIVNYRERYQSDLEKLQPEMARELRMHPDVVRETACVALSDGVFIGAGFLAEANPYRVDAGDEQVRYLRAEFTVLPGCDEEAEASILLLEELQYRFDRLRATDGRKPVMRVWVKSEDTAYTELLFDEGFRVGNVMTVMARDIDETDEWLEDETAEGIFLIFNPNQKETTVTLPEGSWNICVSEGKAGTTSLGEANGIQLQIVEHITCTSHHETGH